MVDGDTVEGTRYFVEVKVNDRTKPEDLLYGPELVDIPFPLTSEMDAIWVAMVEDITADESAAMEEFHRTYTEDEDNGVEHMSEEMCMDYDNNQKWLNDYGYHMIRHMESVVPAATDDPRMDHSFGPVHMHCRMYHHPETHKCLNEMVVPVYIRSVGKNNDDDDLYRYATGLYRGGRVHIPGEVLDWYRGKLRAGMKVPMGISYSPPEEGNHKPFRAKFGIDINLGNVPGTSGGGVLATELPKVHMNYAEAMVDHERKLEKMTNEE